MMVKQLKLTPICALCREVRLTIPLTLTGYSNMSDVVSGLGRSRNGSQVRPEERQWASEGLFAALPSRGECSSPRQNRAPCAEARAPIHDTLREAARVSGLGDSEAGA